MELKVWVDGVQRVVCGVSKATTCQEVVIALAQATGESSRSVRVFRLRAAFYERNEADRESVSAETDVLNVEQQSTLLSL